MSNILACKLYTVKDHSGWPIPREGTITEQNYGLMHLLMTASAELHCEHLDRIITHQGLVNSIQDAFRDHLRACYHLWQEGHNVLSCDLDVVFMKSHNWFQGNQFQMYAHSDPPRTAQFEHYLNCGIKYFPSSLPQSFWDDLFDHYLTWDYSVYDHEQRVLNQLFWSQGSSEEMLHYVDHTKAFQWVGSQEQNTYLNRCDWREASAIHVHGSRGSGPRLELMHKLSSL